MTSNDTMLTDECAEILHIKPTSFRRAIARGTMPVATMKVGHQVLVLRSSFEKLLTDSLIIR